MSTVQEDRAKFLAMSQEEKRKLYKDYTTLAQVPTWDEYFRESRDRLRKQFSETYKTGEEHGLVECEVDPELNKKISLWKGNLVKLEADVIVNAANESLLGGGGVDGAIHSAAGPKLKNECRDLKGCKTGDAKVTAGYALPARYVFHTVGPKGEKPQLLESCYNKTLNLLLQENQCSIAFPCISTGIYGYPQEKAARVALGTVRKFLEQNGSKVERVVFCLFLPEDVKIYENLSQVYFPVEKSLL
ncbi:macro domain-containing protein PG1779-like isoform X1 [Bacillus rossius redtenbacheri]